MKSLPIFLLGLSLLNQVESEKDGFYSYSELKDGLEASKSICSQVGLDYTVTSNPYPLATIKSKKVTFPGLKKILILGGVHGCLTAAARVVSMASNICDGYRYSDYWSNLFYTFQIDIIPSYFESLYNSCYEQKQTGQKDQIIKFLNGEDCKDPDLNINENDNAGCLKSEELTSFISDLEQYTFIINIQGTKSNYDTKTKLSKKQAFVYENVLPDKNRPKKSEGSLVNKILSNDSSFIFQYKHDLLSKIERKKLKYAYSDEFDEIFNALGDNFPPPKIIFYNATEDEIPSESEPSTVTFMFGLWNSYPFNIETDVTINITINENDVYRELTIMHESEIAEFSYYEDNSDVKYATFYATYSSQDDNVKQNATSSYQIYMEKMPVEPLSYKGIKIKYNRTLGGEIKFDIHAWLNSSGENHFTMGDEYKLNGQYVWLVPKEEDKNPAPRSLVLFLMFLIFLVIILVIVCSVLVKSKPKRLLG